MTPHSQEAGAFLPGVLLFDLNPITDERGYFMEAFKENEFEHYVQDNCTFSKKGVLRGLHIQKEPHAHAKLVRCTTGKIFDVIADCNPLSPTYGQYNSFILSGDFPQLLYVPKQYAHGNLALEDSIFEYKVGDYYHPELVEGYLWNDPVLSIAWPLPHPMVTKRDESWLPLKNWS